MGQTISQEDINARAAELLGSFSENYNNVGIDESLLIYSRTDSAATLEDYSSKLLTEVGSSMPDYVEKLGSALSSVSAVPNAVGIGALVISMILQICFIAVKGHQSKEPSTTDFLRRVFAEEKSSEVRDLMEEYLKRYKMHLRDDHLLLENTICLEEQLSAQLTRLKNSMKLDGHMNSHALKHWSNGAVFHTQMLIHIARLKKKQGSGLESARAAAVSAITTYDRDLSDLLETYKTYKISSLKSKTISSPCILSVHKGCIFDCLITDEESGEIHYFNNVYLCIQISSKDYINYMFINDKQILSLKSYFSDLKNNVDVLIGQQGTFNVPAS